MQWEIEIKANLATFIYVWRVLKYTRFILNRSPKKKKSNFSQYIPMQKVWSNKIDLFYHCIFTFVIAQNPIWC